MPLNIATLRAQFPILNGRINGKPLIYLDSAATSQKPQVVLDAMREFLVTTNANVNRGVHPLSERATVAYDSARTVIAKFMNVKHAHEVIFTKNATEAINLVARSFGSMLKKGDVIVLSILEHHSNIVPWLQLQDERGITVEWIDIDDSGRLKLDQLQKILATKKVRLVSVTGMSNVFGTLTPIGEITDLAHQHGALTFIDAAQLIAHKKIDVQAIDADFVAFSGHKLYGPAGIGVLYGKSEHLKKMPPFLGGGDMIQIVTKDGFTPAELPRKFEAGTPPIAEAIGLAAAIEWIESQDRYGIEKHERILIEHAMEKLGAIDGLRILGSSKGRKLENSKAGCISFTLDNIHPHDLTEILGQKGICLRAGHHCTQPLHKRLGIAASTRLSVAAYNTVEEIDACVKTITEAKKILGA